MGLNLQSYECRGERALYKNIPIVHLAEVQEQLRKNFKGLRYRFRGPRYDVMALTCLKRDAKKFSVYTRS
jgi:hypothetical protein